MPKPLRICTIGGGSGMPIINRALVRAGFRRISSIVTTFDSGGDTGRLRTDERGRILAFSDYWRSLLSLWKDEKQKEAWEEMLRYRDGRSRNFGNTFFQFMSEKCGSLSKVDQFFSLLTNANILGEVIPVSVDPAEICFSTISGKTFRGEHNLDDLRMSFDKVTKIWLEPSVKANPEATKAIIDSDLIIICPGSMYGSVLINFLPQGISSAYIKSPAKKVLMTNIMSSACENHGFDQDDYTKTFKRYIKPWPGFDLIIMADMSCLQTSLLKKVLKMYQYEHSFPIKINHRSTQKTVVADIITIEEKNLRLRHCQEKLTNFFLKYQLFSQPKNSEEL